MSDAYTRVKAGRLTFKGGESIDRKKKKRNKKKAKADEDDPPAAVAVAVASASADAVVVEGDEAEAAAGEGDVYTIDAAKRMKYEELFPVESKKFGYDPANKSRDSARTVEQALDDRVRKKADRYCK